MPCATTSKHFPLLKHKGTKRACATVRYKSSFNKKKKTTRTCMFMHLCYTCVLLATGSDVTGNMPVIKDMCTTTSLMPSHMSCVINPAVYL